MANTKNDQHFTPEDYLKAQDHAKDIQALTEKLNKCYSTERFKDFQKDVEENVLKTMGSEEGVKKIKLHATTAAKDYFLSGTANQVRFWLPFIVTLIVAVFEAIRFFRK